MIREELGNQKTVFANQDDSLFSAVPITLDADVYTLETEIVDGRTYAKAGSVVKEGAVVRGILPERYDITEGPKPARVALEGYAYASRLTPAAVAAVTVLPKIVMMPYKAVFASVDALRGLIATIYIEGAKFATTASIAHFTTASTITAVKVAADGNSIDLSFSAEGAVSITAIDADAFEGATGSVLKGLPLDFTLVKGDLNTVTATAGTNGTVTVDKETAAEGEVVTITATPSAGYVIDEIKLDGVKLTAVEGAYTFIMKATAVAVTASFKAQG